MPSSFTVLHLWYNPKENRYVNMITKEGLIIPCTAASTVENTWEYEKGSYATKYYVGKFECKRYSIVG